MPARKMTPAERNALDSLRATTGRNLRRAREILGHSQVEFARRAGLKPNTYNMMERGTKLPSVSAAIAICKAHSLTLDYVFTGDAGDLPPHIRMAIDAIDLARTSVQPQDEKIRRKKMGR